MAFATIMTETRGPVGLLTFDRLKTLNALTPDTMGEVAQALDDFEADPAIRAIVLTGSAKVFVAGTDITHLKDHTHETIKEDDFIARGLDRLRACAKPTIAAVAGYAFGSGFEIALICDMIIAADNAKFSLSEVTIGTTPGSGGIQRLAHTVGKAKTMEMCLTGRIMDAAEAERTGVASRIVPHDNLVEEAIGIGETMERMSAPVLETIRTVVNQAFETSLSDGIDFERGRYHETYHFKDRAEGMAAFVEKRHPRFTHE